MAAGTAAAGARRPTQFQRRRGRHRFEQAIGFALFACAAITVLTTLGIVLILLVEGLQFFRDVTPWEFLGGTKWQPLFTNQSFGVLPLIGGTLLILRSALPDRAVRSPSAPGIETSARYAGRRS